MSLFAPPSVARIVRAADAPKNKLDRPENWELVVSFFVPGEAKPGGSKSAFALRRRDGSLVLRPNGSPVINITDDAKGNRGWKQDVKVFAKTAYSGVPLDGPLKVEASFIAIRPKSHFGSGKNTNILKASAPVAPTVKPDASKYFRSTEDALSGILWVDDARIVRQNVGKDYGEMPGAHISLYRYVG